MSCLKHRDMTRKGSVCLDELLVQEGGKLKDMPFYWKTTTSQLI